MRWDLVLRGARPEVFGPRPKFRRAAIISRARLARNLVLVLREARR